MSLAYIALGSNLGDRIGQMRRALELLQHENCVRVLRTSPIYQNRAVGMGDEADDFLNAVVEVSTELAPLELLDACLDVERQLGRVRSKGGWAPRNIDLDLLFYEGTSLREKRLILPHPRIAERDFVAVPLADLVPELEINGQLAQEMVQALPRGGLRVYPESMEWNISRKDLTAFFPGRQGAAVFREDFFSPCGDPVIHAITPAAGDEKGWAG